MSPDRTSEEYEIFDCQPLLVSESRGKKMNKLEVAVLSEEELQENLEIIKKGLGITQVTINRSDPTIPVSIKYKTGGETKKTLATIFNEAMVTIKHPELQVDSSKEVPSWYDRDELVETVACVFEEEYDQVQRISRFHAENTNPIVRESIHRVLDDLSVRAAKEDRRRTARMRRASSRK